MADDGRAVKSHKMALEERLSTQLNAIIFIRVLCNTWVSISWHTRYRHKRIYKAGLAWTLVHPPRLRSSFILFLTMSDNYILQDKSTLCRRYCCQRAVTLLSGWQTYSIRVMSHQSRDSIIRKRRGKLMGIWAWRSDSRDNPRMRTTEEHIQALVSRRSTKIGNCTPIGVLDL